MVDWKIVGPAVGVPVVLGFAYYMGAFNRGTSAEVPLVQQPVPPVGGRRHRKTKKSSKRKH